MISICASLASADVFRKMCGKSAPLSLGELYMFNMKSVLSPLHFGRTSMSACCMLVLSIFEKGTDNGTHVNMMNLYNLAHISALQSRTQSMQ